MAEESTMDHVVQVELRTGTTHTMTWLNTALKPKPGMVLLRNGDPRPWTVVQAYNLTVQETRETHTNWKVDGHINVRSA
jgi:bifunctional N-acetylglucosamine-1-phosphate-uridyltransferase/glucosamine-1-phosphate-acetyltransferase GlmU-like protein